MDQRNDDDLAGPVGEEFSSPVKKIKEESKFQSNLIIFISIYIFKMNTFLF